MRLTADDAPAVSVACGGGLDLQPGVRPSPAYVPPALALGHGAFPAVRDERVVERLTAAHDGCEAHDPGRAGKQSLELPAAFDPRPRPQIDPLHREGVEDYERDCQ